MKRSYFISTLLIYILEYSYCLYVQYCIVFKYFVWVLHIVSLLKNSLLLIGIIVGVFFGPDEHFEVA